MAQGGTLKAIVQYAQDEITEIIDSLGEGETFSIYDIIPRLFDKGEPFIIGYYQSKVWIEENGLCAFDVIQEVQEFEMETWGSCITKINSEEILTTFVFIKGSEYMENLNSYKTFINSDKEYYTKDELMTIVDEIENDLN
jgi:hypothetical protein